MSSRRTLSPPAAAAVAIVLHVVVFPTPPLLTATAKDFMGSLMCAFVHLCTIAQMHVTIYATLQLCKQAHLQCATCAHMPHCTNAFVLFCTCAQMNSSPRMRKQQTCANLS